MTIDGGAAYTTQTAVSLTFSAPSDTTEVALTNAATLDCASATYVGFVSPYAWSLSSGDGTKTVRVCFRDAAGNTASASDTIVLDTTPPSGTVTIAGGDAYTSSTSVVLSFSASADVVEVSVAEAATLDCASATYQPYAPSMSLTLSSSAGTKTVVACFRDGAGLTGTASDSIVLDSSAPSGSVVLAGGAAYTTSADVSVSLTFPNDTTGYAVSEGTSLDCTTATYTSVSVGSSSATTSLTLGAGDGTKTVTACFRDGGGLYASAADSIVLDTTSPAGSLLVDQGAAYATSTSVTLTLSAPSDTVGMAVGEGASLDCTTATYEAFSTTRAFVLSAGDGSKTVWACFKDAAGNLASASDGIVLDTTAPSGTLLLAGGAATTTTTVVSLEITASSDVHEVALVNGASLDCQTANYGSLLSPSTWVLASTDGTQTVTACLRDDAGNVASISDTVTLDTTPPSGTITVAGGAAYATATPLNVALTFPNDTTGYALGEGALACDTAVYTSVPAQSTSATTTFTPSTGDGVKTIVACFRDTAGNTAAASDTINLDTTVPGGAVSIEGGATYATSTSVTLTLDAPADTAQMAIANGGVPDCATATYVSYTSSYLWTLNGGDGTKTVGVCFRDAAGNTATATDTILLDATAPSGTVAIENGAAYTASTSVVLSITADADVEAMAIADGSSINCATATYEPFSASRLYALPSGDGAKTVSVCLRDAAGLTSSASDSIVLDTTPPTTATLQIDGGATYTTDAGGMVTLTLTTPETVSVAIANETIDCNAATYTTFASPRSWILQDEDGVRTVVACFKDSAGWTVTKSASIILDRVAPTVALTIAGEASSTTTDLVDLSLAADSDASQMAVGNGTIDCALATYGAYASSVASFDLDPADDPVNNDGAHVVTACVRDAAGNTGSASAGILLDRRAPDTSAATVTIVGALGDGTASTSLTTTRSVLVQLTGISDALAPNSNLEAEVSEDSSFAGATWFAFDPSFPYNLSSSDGAKTIYLRFRDPAGNVSSTLSGNITLDQTPPTSPGVLIADGASYTNSTIVKLQIWATGASEWSTDNGVTWNPCSTNPCASTAPGETHSGFSLGAVSDGLVYVGVRFRDAARNESPVALDTIVVDTTPPSPPNISTISPRTTSALVTLSGGADVPPASGKPYSGFDHYLVEVYDVADMSAPIKKQVLTSTSDWITGLPAYHNYKVAAVAVDRAGNSSPLSKGALALVGVAPTVTTNIPGIPGWGDEAISYRNQVLVAGVKPDTQTGYALVSCDGRMQPCSEADFSLTTYEPPPSALPPASRLEAVRATAANGNVWIFGLRKDLGTGSYSIEAMVFDGDPDDVSDLGTASWRWVPLGSAAANVVSKSFAASAGGKAVAVSYLALDGTGLPAAQLHLCITDGSCTTASGWSGPYAVTAGTATENLPRWTDPTVGVMDDMTSLEIDVGENHMWMAQTVYDSGAGTFATVIRGCTITFGCHLSSNWTTVRLSEGAGVHYATTVLEGASNLYVESVRDGALGPVVTVWTCALGRATDNWNLRTCSSVADFSTGVNVQRLSKVVAWRNYMTAPWYQIEAPRLPLVWHAGVLWSATVDLGKKNLLVGRCNTHISDCGVGTSWTWSAVVEGLVSEPQALLAHIDGNPVVVGAADDTRSYIVEPPTRAPPGRAIVPDWQQQGLRATWLAQNTNTMNGFRVDYRLVGQPNFTDSAIVGTQASEGTALSVLAAGTTHEGVVSSFDGQDLGPAEPIFATAPGSVLDSDPLGNWGLSAGDIPAKYAANGACQAFAYVPNDGWIHVAFCAIGQDCSLSSAWASVKVRANRAIGDLALALDPTSRTPVMAHLVYAYASEPQNLEYVGIPVGMGCMAAGTNTYFTIVQDTGTAASPTPKLAPRSLSALTDGTRLYVSWDRTDASGAPVSAQMNLSVCNFATGCGVWGGWTTISWDYAFDGGPLALAPNGKLYWAPVIDVGSSLEQRLWRCAGTTGCDAQAEWSAVGSVFRGLAAAFPTSLRIDPAGSGSTRYRVVVSQGDRIAWCNEGWSCETAEEWTRATYLASPYHNLTAVQYFSPVSLSGLDIGVVSFGSESWGMARCKARCWDPGEWVGGFTRPPVGVGVSSGAGSVWDSVGPWVGLATDGTILGAPEAWNWNAGERTRSVVQGSFLDYWNP